MDNSLKVKAIQNILEENFFVPSYQRGYRWKEQQVNDLLNDLWYFKQNPPSSLSDKDKPFYCLQPIVIKKNQEQNNNWELIDGQQRLTTILILLHYFNQTEFKNPKPIFQLKFETRIDSADFLIHIEDDSLGLKNIDYFHISEAYKTIHKWFSLKEKDNSAIRSEFYPTLINDTKVIWYEVNDGSNTVDIFTRLNMGKIQLTNAELIKALFLKNSNFKNHNDDEIKLKKLQIATEWDSIEYALQDDSFWFFIFNNSKKYSTRIEFIFDLMKEKDDNDEDYHTFYKFNDEFELSKNGNENPNIDSIWLKVKQYFLTFEAWYKDRELYHLIGFLVERGTSIQYLKNNSEKITKTKFKEFLVDEIKKTVNIQIDDIEYKNPKVKTILLLFNIETILQNKKSNIRFPFDSFKTENWDIEHVRSQTDKDISGPNRHDWARDNLEYFTGEKNRPEQVIAIKKLDLIIQEYCTDLINILDSDKIDDENFQKLFKKIQLYFKEDIEPDNLNSLSNLALLDSYTNRSYKNAYFPIKRKTILENDMKGIFIPICTKNVFLKYYSKQLGEIMFWKNEDATAYLNTIKETLKNYLPTQLISND